MAISCSFARHARWLAILTLSAPLAAQVPAERPDIPPAIIDVELQGSLLTAEDAFDIAARIDRFERLTVPVTIDGAGPYRFLVDTGSQATVVSDDLADGLGLPALGQARLVATGSSATVPVRRLDRLEFAGREFNNLTSPLLARRHVGADGIIGLDSLQELSVLIDFRDDTIRVVETVPEREAGADPFEIVVRAKRRFGQMVITDAHIDGVRTSVIIDTGAQNSIGNRSLQNRLRAKRWTKTVSTDVNGTQFATDLALAKRLRLGDLLLSDVQLGFADSPVFETLGLDDRPALILGITTLRAFDRVAIDFAGRRVMFDMPAGAGRRWRQRPDYPMGQ